MPHDELGCTEERAIQKQWKWKYKKKHFQVTAGIQNPTENNGHKHWVQ